MLPTRPRLAVRSIRSSCTTPASSTATRVSCGVTLIRTSSLTRRTHPLDHLGRLVQRQPHDSGIAAADGGDELRGAALDRVGAGLVVGLAGGQVLANLVFAQLAKLHHGARQL